MQRRGSCSDPNPIACRDCRTPTHRVVPISAGKKETKASEVNLDEQRRLGSPSSISRLNSEQMTHLITNICLLRWVEFPSHLSTDTLEIIFVEGRFMINFAWTGMTWKWMDSCNLLLSWQLLYRGKVGNCTPCEQAEQLAGKLRDCEPIFGQGQKHD